MTTASCQSPLAWDNLLAYWLGELDPEREAQVEEHYLGCDQCSGRLQLLAELGRELRRTVRTSGVNMVLSESFVQRLITQGLHVREYDVPLNGSVNCTVTTDDDIVVARLEAPFTDVDRIDMVYVSDAGEQEMRQEDIPFSAKSGTVIFASRIAALRALPQTILRVRLLAVDDKGERPLGEYTFNHTPSSS